MELNSIVLNPADASEGEFFYKNFPYCDEDGDYIDFTFIDYDLCGDDLEKFCRDLKETEEKYYNFIENQACVIAKTDVENGVSSAIEKLEKFGFDCSSYWETMKDIKDPDASLKENGIREEYEDIFIENTSLAIRDRLYRELGIYRAMQDAYDNYKDKQKEIEMGE